VISIASKSFSGSWKRASLFYLSSPPNSVNEWREAVVAVTKEGLLKRHNYDVEIAGGIPGAHYIDAYVEVSGIKSPTVHRIFAPQEDASVN
jgi:hypothetical protein